MSWSVYLMNSEIASITDASQLEMMKLWKGLFYTFWMSDKPDIQEELAIALAGMVSYVFSLIMLQVSEFRKESLSILYIQCFWKTLVREWGGIDRYRMDKYMLLMRKILDQMLLLLQTVISLTHI